MKKFKHIILLLLTSVLFTGCYKIETELDINRNNDMEITAIIWKGVMPSEIIWYKRILVTEYNIDSSMCELVTKANKYIELDKKVDKQECN